MSVFQLDALLQTFAWDESNMLHAELCIPSDLLAFDGHFPGRPILPGIVQIQIARAIIEKGVNFSLQLDEIVRGRMSIPVEPYDTVRVEIKWTALREVPAPLWKARIHFYKDEKLATRLTCSFSKKKHSV